MIRTVKKLVTCTTMEELNAMKLQYSMTAPMYASALAILSYAGSVSFCVEVENPTEPSVKMEEPADKLKSIIKSLAEFPELIEETDTWVAEKVAQRKEINKKKEIYDAILNKERQLEVLTVEIAKLKSEVGEK